MPKQVVASKLGAKLGDKLNKGFVAHKNDEVKTSGAGELPPGIDDGIAQLVEIKLDTYKKGDQKGEFYFYAAAVVMEPEFHENEQGRRIKVRGKRTSIMEPLCDTPKRSRPDVDSHLAWIMNQLKLMGVDVASWDQSNVAAELEAACDALKELKPFINFRTWKGEATEQYPNPRTNHDWGGLADDPGVSADAVQDNTAGDGVAGSETDPEDDANVADVPKEPEGGGDVPYGDRLDMLADKVDKDNDKEAKAELVKLAEEAGVPKKKVNDADNWAAVADMIRAAGGGAPAGATGSANQVDPVKLGQRADAGEDDAQECADALTALATAAGLNPDDPKYTNWEMLGQATVEANREGTPSKAPAPSGAQPPKKEEVYHYFPRGKGVGGKPGAKAKKPVECEVKAVNTKTKTVDLMSLADGKTEYKAVPWDELADAA